MADKKITELDELTAPVAASVLPIVDNPDAVVPVTKKIQFQNLVAVIRDAATHALYVLLGGGNARGVDAVDLQSLRTDGAQVASGVAATVGGGGDNTASGDAATVPGGHSNIAAGDYSVAMGRKANAAHDGAAVIADATDAQTSSELANQLVLRYTGGVLIATAVDISGLPTKGIRIPGNDEDIQDLGGNSLLGGTGGGGGGMNIIRNWLFANAPAGPSAAPAGWASDGGTVFSYITAEGGWGGTAVRCTAPAAPPPTSGISQVIKPRPSTSYRVHARLKTGGTAYLQTTGGAADVNESTTSGSWVTLSGTVTSDATPTDITVKIICTAGNTVDIAAVWVVEGTADTVPTPGRGYHLVQIPAGAWSYPPDENVAELDLDTGTNGYIYRQLMDVNDYLASVFTVPGDIDPAGSVIFIAAGYAVTAAAGKTIQLSFNHAARASGESWDAAYTAENASSGVSSSQDVLDYIAWSETVANLVWYGNDQVRVKLGRIASGTELSGAWGLTDFFVLIPTL